MSNEQEQYLASIGAQILAQQLAEAQLQPPRLTQQQQQQLINSHITIERDRREVERKRDAARAKKAEMEKVRQAAFQEVEKERAEREREHFRQGQLARWIGTEAEFNRVFDKLWDDERVRRLQQESSDIERTKAQMRARNPDGYIF